MDEFWEASRYKVLIPGVGGLRVIHWAHFMSVVNWILWPLFIATLTNYIFRRR
jgi:hypothetical protein